MFQRILRAKSTADPTTAVPASASEESSSTAVGSPAAEAEFYARCTHRLAHYWRDSHLPTEALASLFELLQDWRSLVGQGPLGRERCILLAHEACDQTFRDVLNQLQGGSAQHDAQALHAALEPLYALIRRSPELISACPALIRVHHHVEALLHLTAPASEAQPAMTSWARLQLRWAPRGRGLPRAFRRIKQLDVRAGRAHQPLLLTNALDA